MSRVLVITIGYVLFCLYASLQASTPFNIMTQKPTLKQKTASSVLNGKARKVQEVFYNSRGQEVKQVNFSPEGRVISILTKTYDSNGKLQARAVQEMTTEKASGEIQKWTYEHVFDKLGRPIQTIIRKEGDELIRTEIFDYNQESSYQNTIKEGEATIEIKVYDTAGRLVRSINLKNNKTMVFSYDANGHLIQHTESSPGKPTRTIQYKNEYNNANQLASVTWGNTRVRYAYNEHNDIKEEIHEGPNGEITSIIRYSYEYW
jgi:YD repeat-containing protein